MVVQQFSTLNANDIKKISMEALLNLLTDESKKYIEYLILLFTESASRGEICMTLRFDAQISSEQQTHIARFLICSNFKISYTPTYGQELDINSFEISWT